MTQIGSVLLAWDVPCIRLRIIFSENSVHIKIRAFQANHSLDSRICDLYFAWQWFCLNWRKILISDNGLDVGPPERWKGCCIISKKTMHFPLKYGPGGESYEFVTCLDTWMVWWKGLNPLFEKTVLNISNGQGMRNSVKIDFIILRRSFRERTCPGSFSANSKVVFDTLTSEIKVVTRIECAI